MRRRNDDAHVYRLVLVTTIFADCPSGKKPASRTGHVNKKYRNEDRDGPALEIWSLTSVGVGWL